MIMKTIQKSIGIMILTVMTCTADAKEKDPNAKALTQEQLIAGASTDVPSNAQPEGYISLVDGGPLHIMSAVTGVEFHVPGKISSAEGGLSPTPHLLRKTAIGIEYWFITGELSGYFTDEFGQHIVMGPIDLQGVSHRSETFGPGAHPRSGLPGAFFALSVPVKNFNGGLIQIEAAGDGGFLWPAAPLLFNPVDPVVLLERGYAVFTFGQGGTVHEGIKDEVKTIDTNPDSGSGIFWIDPLADDENPKELVSYLRPSFFDEATETETALPSDYTLTFFDGELITIPFGDPAFIYGSVHMYPEIISDTVIFAKNLVQGLFPRRQVTWATYVGWSGSGRAAVLIDSNTRAGAFQVEKTVGPQAGGGAYNVWGNPDSGLRYDAFISYAGANDSQGYLDQGIFNLIPSDVNPTFPISAPFVWIVPEGDVTLPQSAAYAYANKVWHALSALGRGHEVNDFIRIYSIPGATHQERDQLFSAFNSKDDKGGLWYDYADILPNPGAFNEDRHGLRVSDPYAQALPFNGPLDSWDFFFHGKAKLPRDTPLWLQTIANLRKYSQRGTPLPVSRVDSRIFENIEEVSTETVLPQYPLVPFTFPDPFSEEEFFAEVYSVSHSIEEDSGIVATPLSSEEVEVFLTFAHDNPLKRSTRPILLPDVAAALGTNFFFFDLVFQVPFNSEQLLTRYGTHGGHVSAVATATNALVRDRLWDAKLGSTYVREAAKSKILLSSPALSASAQAPTTRQKIRTPQNRLQRFLQESQEHRPQRWGKYRRNRD